MDELWQRYRTFWTPVLIGLGVFLVGVIVVHIMSDDPEVGMRRMNKAKKKLGDMKAPASSKASTLRRRGEALRDDVYVKDATPPTGWATRSDQTGGNAKDRTAVAAEQALRASILRGADEDTAKSASLLKARFNDDEVAADKAYRRFQRLLTQHSESLRSGDPNVAFSRLLSDVWSELRIRGNRADVEFEAPAEQLGFGAIASVSRATLTARVLNLALAARLVDVAIREDMESIGQIGMRNQLEPGSAEDFVSLWPIEVSMVGDWEAVKQVLALLTDPANPVPMDISRLTQPKRSANSAGSGLVQFSVTASSVIVRPTIDLRLDVEEDK
jgi:hypothetical protein